MTMSSEQHWEKAETLLTSAELSLSRDYALTEAMTNLARIHFLMAVSGSGTHRQDLASYRDAVNAEEQDQVHPKERTFIKVPSKGKK